MRRVAALIMAFLLVCTLSGSVYAEVKTVAGDGERILNCYGKTLVRVNLRPLPKRDDESKPIAQLERGDIVWMYREIINRDGESWTYIRVDDKEGYVMSFLIQPVDEPPEASNDDSDVQDEMAEAVKISAESDTGFIVNPEEEATNQPEGALTSEPHQGAETEEKEELPAEESEQNTEQTEGKKKEKPQNEYNLNGSLKVAYDFTAEGYVARVNHYNRYGKIRWYTVTTEWDSDGNILKDAEYHPLNLGKYSEYRNEYAYDQNGNQVSVRWFRKDGKLGGSSASEYDAAGLKTSTVHYSEDGSVSDYSVDFRYDDDENVISYTSLDSGRNVKYYYQAKWENGICIESTETDADGQVIDHTFYDPVYGDELKSEYVYDGFAYSSFRIYSSNGYEEDWRSNNYRSVTQYDTDERQIKSLDYRRESKNASWEQESECFYTYQDNGHVIANTVYTDGSRYVSEKDEDWNTLLSTSYNTDGTFNYSYQSEYNSEGQEIRSNRLNETGEIESYVYYEYDQKGNQIRRTCYHADGSFWYCYESIYNEKGQQIRQNELTANGAIDGYTLYEYDDLGRQLSAVDYNKGGIKQYEFLYRYLEDGSTQHKYNWYDSTGTLQNEGEWE